MRYKMEKFKSGTLKRTNVRKNYFELLARRLYFGLSWRICPTKTKETFSKHFFTPKAYSLSSSEQNIMDQAEKFELDLAGKTVQGWKWGKGKVVFLVHGWSGRGIQLAPFIEPLRDAGFSVVTWDKPGHGESGGTRTNYFEFTHALAKMTEKFEVPNVAGIIAHSMGAGATINWLSKEKFFGKVVLIAPLLKVSETLSDGVASYGIPKGLFHRVMFDLEESTQRNLQLENPMELAHSIDSEVHIFHDYNDRAVPFAHSFELSQKKRNFILHPTLNLGHNRILKDEKVIRSIVEKFDEKRISTTSYAMSATLNESSIPLQAG